MTTPRKEILIGDWAAGKYESGDMFGNMLKLPTDPRTLIRAYHAAVRYRRALDQKCMDPNAIIDFMCDIDKAIAKKAKRVK